MATLYFVSRKYGKIETALTILQGQTLRSRSSLFHAKHQMNSAYRVTEFRWELISAQKKDMTFGTPCFEKFTLKTSLR